jgi:hypothetical protein
MPRSAHFQRRQLAFNAFSLLYRYYSKLYGVLGFWGFGVLGVWGIGVMGLC